MKLSIIVQIIVIIFFFQQGFSQEEVINKKLVFFDSIYHSETSKKNKIRLSSEFIKEIFALTNNINLTDSVLNIVLLDLKKYKVDTTEIVSLFYHKSIVLRENNEYEDCEELLLNILKKDDELIDEDLSILYYSLGELYKKTNRFDEALNQYYKIQKLSNVHEQLLLQAKFAISQIHAVLGDYKRSLKVGKEVYETFKHPFVLDLIINSFINLEYTDSVILYGNMYFEHNEVNAINASSYLSCLYVKVKIGKNLNAIENNILSVKKVLNNNADYRQYFNLLGVLYFKKKEYELSKQNYNKVLHYIDDANNRATVRDLNRNILQACFFLNIPDSTEKYFETYLKVRNEIDSLNHYEVLKELETKFETEKKETEIKLLGKNKEILTLNNKRKKLWLIILIGGLFTVGGLFILYIKRTKIKRELIQKQLENKALEEKILKDELINQQKQLTIYLDELAEKNELLSNFKQIKIVDQEILRVFNEALDGKGDFEDKWSNITVIFDSLYPNFSINLIHKLKDQESLSQNELRLAMLLKLNLSTKKIADILYVSEGAISKARQRLKKKIEDNKDLVEVINSLS